MSNFVVIAEQFFSLNIYVDALFVMKLIFYTIFRDISIVFYYIFQHFLFDSRKQVVRGRVVLKQNIPLTCSAAAAAAAGGQQT